jgi:hypothetical protein
MGVKCSKIDIDSLERESLKPLRKKLSSTPPDGDDSLRPFYFESGQRIARVSDIDRLLVIERDSWAPSLRHSRTAILNFIKKYPFSVFVQEDTNGNLLGVIYTKRINDIEKIDSVRWNANDFHGYSVDDQGGSFLQLMRVNTIRNDDSNTAAIGVGCKLRDLALRYASYLGIHFVCALTRCSAYDRDECSYIKYLAQIEKNNDVHPSDPGLNFHLLRGAKFVRIANGWRKEDSLNEGNAVLVVYDLKKVEDAYSWTEFAIQQKNYQPHIELSWKKYC